MIPFGLQLSFEKGSSNDADHTIENTIQAGSDYECAILSVFAQGVNGYRLHRARDERHHKCEDCFGWEREPEELAGDVSYDRGYYSRNEPKEKQLTIANCGGPIIVWQVSFTRMGGLGREINGFTRLRPIVAIVI